MTSFIFLTFIFILVKVVVISAIQCHYYNETCGPQCSTIEECPSDQHCYALWSNSTNSTDGGPRPKLKGCFLGSGGDCAGEKECVHRGTLRSNMLFCCCKDNLCNENTLWEPTPPPPPIEQPAPKARDTLMIFAFTGILLFFAISIIVYVLKKPKISYFKKVPLLDQHPPSAPEKHLQLELQEVIARGKFGVVRRAINQSDKEVVVVKITSAQEEQSWLTEKEVYQLPLMDHENILRFIAAERRVENLQTQLWLVTAYHELGSLQDFLKTNTVTWSQLCRISCTMAKGLSHLHEEIWSEDPGLYKPAVAHRDFKSSNVLLKTDLTACIADFGLALVFQPSSSCGDTHGQVGTRRYMPPEVLEGAINFSRDAFVRIDMYACGLVLWEIVSRCSAQGHVPNYKLPFEAEIGTHPSLEDIQDVVVHKKLRPVIKESWKEYPGFQILCETIEECWDHDAEARLSASCVIERIQSLNPTFY